MSKRPQSAFRINKQHQQNNTAKAPASNDNFFSTKTEQNGLKFQGSSQYDNEDDSQKIEPLMQYNNQRPQYEQNNQQNINAKNNSDRDYINDELNNQKMHPISKQ